MPYRTVTAHDHAQLQTIRQWITTSSRVVFITGAGVSTNQGIPDFRSSDGIFNMNSKTALDALLDPTSFTSTTEETHYRNAIKRLDNQQLLKNAHSIFQSSSLATHSSAEVLFMFVALLHRRILHAQPREGSIHKLLSHLAKECRLQRCYTQNIDGLEEVYGLRTDTRIAAETTGSLDTVDYGSFHVVQLHGDVGTARCLHAACVETMTKQTIENFIEGRGQSCQRCHMRALQRQARGKRPGNSMTRTQVRPNIVLYHELHPFADHIHSVVQHDVSRDPDLLVIVGTSLKVEGVQELLKGFGHAVHNKKGKVIYVNDTNKVNKNWESFIDYFIEMDSDDWATAMLQLVRESNGRLATRLSDQVQPPPPSPPPPPPPPKKPSAPLAVECDDETWLTAYFDD